MNHEMMYKLGCKFFALSIRSSSLLLVLIFSHFLASGWPFYDPELVGKMKKSQLLAAQLKKIIGIHQVKVASNRAPTESETGTGTGAGSSTRVEGGGESHVPIQTENQTRIEEVEMPRADVDPPKRQRVLQDDAFTSYDLFYLCCRPELCLRGPLPMPLMKKSRLRNCPGSSL